MLDKTSHPFIVNTLESSIYWSLKLEATPKVIHGPHGVFPWIVYMLWNEDRHHEDTQFAGGTTPSEALDRLEAELAGRASE